MVQLDFGAAFDRASHSDLLFELKSFGEGGSVLSICREFLSNHRQWVVVSESQSFLAWSVLGPLLFIPYTSEMFELVENRLYAQAADSTLLAVVRKPADGPAVAASLNRDFARIH